MKLKTHYLKKTMLLGALTLANVAFSQLNGPIEYPCNQWVDREVNSEADYAYEHYSGIRYGFQKIFYISYGQTFIYTDPDALRVTNVFGNNYQNFGVLNYNAPKISVSSSTELQFETGKVYYRANDAKIHSLQWNGSMWTDNIINTHPQAEIPDFGYFEVSNNGNIFFKGNGGVNVITGPNPQDAYPLIPNGPVCWGDIEIGGNKIYFVGPNFKIHYYYQGANNQWNYAIANPNAAPAMNKTPLMYDNGDIYYINHQNQVSYISTSTGVSTHGVVNSSAPLARGFNIGTAAMDNNKIVYIGTDNRFHMLTKNGANWNYSLIHSTAQASGLTNIDFVDGRGIAYTSPDYRLHELFYVDCHFDDGINPPSFKKDNSNQDSGNLRNTEFNVYPNPVSDVLNISINSEINSEIIIEDLKGQIIYKQRANEGFQNLTIDLSNISSGFYLVKQVNANGVYTQKIIKK